MRGMALHGINISGVFNGIFQLILLGALQVTSGFSVAAKFNIDFVNETRSCCRVNFPQKEFI